MEVNVVYLVPIVTILVLIYRWLTKDNDYFHDKPIPSMAAVPLLGSTGPLLLKKYTFGDFAKMLYDKYPGVKVFGFFDTGVRFFALRDPELIKKVAVKDFDYFTDRRPIFGDSKDNNNEHALFSKTLVMMTDQKWRDMRATLSPAFTGSKMRSMFELIVEYSDRVIQVLRQEASQAGHIDYEMRDFFSRIANDIIATCAFGLQVESVKNRENEFYVMGKKMMNINRPLVLLRVLAIRCFPRLTARLGIDIFDKDHIRYFSKIIKEAVRARDEHGIVRPDMIHLLMQAKKGVLKHQHEVTETGEGFATVQESSVGKASVSSSMTEPEFIAQCLIFFVGGFDTVSNAMMLMAYELAINPDIQQKLYEECSDTNNQLEGKSPTYDTLQKLKYMDMVVSESLRMYPVPALDRVCVRDYVLDDGEGLKFTIDKGTCVWFPVHGIHRDPKYYVNPDKFDPERFSEANRASINMDTYLPFGVGPRNCIGSRFALMEMKSIMYQLLLNFRIERTEQTQVPLKFAKGMVGLVTEKGLHLRMTLRK